ncbi:bifunctional 2-C-methyl-D-erythritol 4-phosphate cytidylyltransferase/2-C-methyl-D-erythritol 2,4-cyclodiphosphate synthase [Methylovirgula sp. 4M-Z18]|uniref:bifunctional 2-C-methyl-D-erythritol 4-phosphate cytidylyltransferase/2-C-methyl-D-erythritol 2,4-cyclodiphosphate synthase n=1 Tax=Methylovirgula sp. 4M-Z18 TaxID=2293567 RepID=UPI000E2EE2F9|nr:bifunctional 2-C-methyl-D-erythritol 4-phosphate cytidylyltransferase/2-C-methyl-D-erythritol 2,4-cyclodiphosphate synthase [Methylovirgula sp. 4M-Z18]RFB80256.1 bifunctional 2-C-methyl-D-erythritol 4-phosphate cytidylyltransferase/2-C-methyl-D-erythritol 2,4-cyclodiphosphate synthase [Methylovirgula sp. 4M-Z18]
MTAPHRFILVVAAGRGMRAGAGVPKQYRALGGDMVLARTLRTCIEAGRVLAVIHPDDAALFAEAQRSAAADSCLPPAFGAETRQASVHAGLEALASHGANEHALVAIHDAARPFADAALFDRAFEEAARHGAAVPGVPVTDTIKQIDRDGFAAATHDRAMLRAIQTPQAFRFDLILAAHRQAAQADLRAFTDDAALMEWAGHRVHVFPGDPSNMKLTTEEDFAAAETRLLLTCPDIRIGQGYDVHAFVPGDHVWLGGVKIPHDQALSGHSDADVLLHALTDAILGALGDGDIGQHFPPSDPQWKGAASHLFLRDAVRRVKARGGIIAHLDGTLVCEAPKVGPHREAMRTAIAEIAGISRDRVGVKATTSEKLGFTGRREGIAALATATIRLPIAP